MFRFFHLKFFVCFTWWWTISLACNGYGLKNQVFKNCHGKDDNVYIKNVTVHLNNECEIVPTGCWVIRKELKTFEVDFALKKGKFEKNGTVDACEQLEDDDSKQKAKKFRAPTACPFKKTRVCYDGKIKQDISKYKNYLGMAAGDINSKINIKHDGTTSCLLYKVTLYKK